MKGENFKNCLIYKRRGKELNSIPIQIGRDHYLDSLTTPCDTSNVFKWPYSPIKNNYECFNAAFDISMHCNNELVEDVKPLADVMNSVKIESSSTCHHFHNFSVFQNKHFGNVTKEAQLSPSCIADDFSEYLDDIKLETAVSPLKDLENSTKINWLKSDCCPNSNHAITALNSPKEGMRLLLPENSEMITPNTPVVLKRKGKKELNVYLPKKITADEVTRLTPKILSKLRRKQSDGGLFVFPPVESSEQKKKKEASTLPNSDIDNTTNQLKEYRKLKAKGKRHHLLKTRDFHNKLERLRRGQQYERFQKLREVVPNMKNKPKAPKISILQAAVSYIRQLREQEMLAKETIIIEKRRNDYLLKRLCYLTKLFPKTQ